MHDLNRRHAIYRSSTFFRKNFVEDHKKQWSFFGGDSFGGAFLYHLLVRFIGVEQEEEQGGTVSIVPKGELDFLGRCSEETANGG